MGLTILAQRLVFFSVVTKLDKEHSVVGHQPITLGTSIFQLKNRNQNCYKKNYSCVFYKASKYPQMKVICIPST